MIRRPRGRVVLSTVTTAAIAAVLVGCSVESPASDASMQPSMGTSASEGRAAPAEPSSGTTPTPSRGADDKPGDRASAPASTEQVEVPGAAEPTVDSLSELLQTVDDGPLVSTPLPRSARARGRLVPRFPVVLRPTRAAQVESSSVSPSGDRLQVALVASTALAPADVLLAYRTRLGRRGLVEHPTPVTAPGSEAAAFSRGRSVVTVTVTEQGSRTSYSVSASLHTGGA